MAEHKKIIVVTSVSSEDVAISIAQELLENYHAACINIIPRVRSIYRWKGQITDDRESVLIIKSRQDHFTQVRATIEALSGYECPEVLSFIVDSGSAQFLEWVDLNLDPRKSAKVEVEDIPNPPRNMEEL